MFIFNVKLKILDTHYIYLNLMYVVHIIDHFAD